MTQATHPYVYGRYLLKLGDHVQCPADRGDPAYRGVVWSIAPAVHQNRAGVSYRWVTVRTMDGRSSHVWPSHRLGEKLP